jgi:hypothetical protein
MLVGTKVWTGHSLAFERESMAHWLRDLQEHLEQEEGDSAVASTLCLVWIVTTSIVSNATKSKTNHPSEHLPSGYHETI